VKEEIDDEFKVDIFSDFGLSMRATQDIEALIKMRAVKDITHETFLEEMKRRDVLNEMVNVEAEAQLAGSQLSLVGAE
jgi:hypothetical protein